MNSTQCTVYSVQCTVYSVQCTVYSVKCTVYSVQCTVYSVQFTVYTGCMTEGQRALGERKTGGRSNKGPTDRRGEGEGVGWGGGLHSNITTQPKSYCCSTTVLHNSITQHFTTPHNTVQHFTQLHNTSQLNSPVSPLHACCDRCFTP